MNITAVILAAGKGTRMHSPHAKTVHTVAQKPMIEHVIAAAKEAGAEEIVVVVGHRQEEIRSLLGTEVLYAEQKELLGTGDAMKCAMPFVTGDTVMVLSGDAPLIRPETLKEAYDFHRKAENAVTVLSAKVENPFGYGRILRGENGILCGIVEEKDADSETKKIDEVNSGMYCFDSEKLRKALPLINNNNAQKEYLLTDTIAVLRQSGENAGAYCMENEEEMYGVNDMEQLYAADRIMRRRVFAALSANGVRIWNPENTYISPDVQIKSGAEILPGCILFGKTEIGADTSVGPDTMLENCRIGERCTVVKSVGRDAEVGDGTNVGPFAYLRPGARVGEGCRVGDFVELKNVSIGNGTKVSHLTYVGDAEVGEKVNFGCGTVTVNYDGKKKYKTEIGNHAFIGCNTNLVAPVRVGDGAYIAAGSTITDAVPEETLAIARARQVIKENWKDKRK